MESALTNISTILIGLLSPRSTMGADINRVIIFIVSIVRTSVARHREAITESVLAHAREWSVPKTT